MGLSVDIPNNKADLDLAELDYGVIHLMTE